MSKELVERLRAFVGQYDCPDGVVDEAADLIERQSRIIEHLVELFVDTTTVENPERELVVIAARALTPEEGE